MTTIQYREVIKNGCLEAEIVDEHYIFNLAEFSQACGQSPEWVLQLLEYEILPARSEVRIHQFFGEELSRARRAYRLQRDFDASLSAVAMMMDLIDEKLKIVIEYRIRYPEASLADLSDIISRETGNNITKSGLNHRFRKIREMISNIENKD